MLGKFGCFLMQIAFHVLCVCGQKVIHEIKKDRAAHNGSTVGQLQITEDQSLLRMDRISARAVITSEPAVFFR